jgi:Tfp pilus assembly protein FimV
MILSRLRAGERLDHFETVRVAKDGHSIPISLTVSPIRDSTGFTIGASSIARDITFRKQSEAQLAKAREDLIRANEQLERRVRERTAELEEANAALLKTMDEQHQLEAQLRHAQKWKALEHWPAVSRTTSIIG